jgi:hypothetical protein
MPHGSRRGTTARRTAPRQRQARPPHTDDPAPGDTTTAQTAKTSTSHPHTRPLADRSRADAATLVSGDPTPDPSTPGHPTARRALPTASHPTGPHVETASRATERRPGPDQSVEPTTEEAHPPAGEPSADQAIMHTRLAAMAQPRASDDAELAALRHVLRDHRLMAHITAEVDQWPPLNDEQRETLAALLNPTRKSR